MTELWKQNLRSKLWTRSQGGRGVWLMQHCPKPGLDCQRFFAVMEASFRGE